MIYDRLDNLVQIEHIPIKTARIQKETFFSTPASMYSIMILESGCISIHIGESQFSWQAPVLLCFNENNLNFQLHNIPDLKIIYFDPKLIYPKTNAPINQQLKNNTSFQHALLQLAPFSSNNIDEHIFTLNLDTSQKIIKNFLYIEQNLSLKKDWYWPYRTRSYLLDIVSIIERMYYPFEKDSIYKFVPNELVSITDYINNHLDEKITLDSIYNRFHINKCKIEQLFKEYYNITFYEYLTNRRFDVACHYLQSTDLDGELIAERIGLSSSQNFCKFFRSKCDLSPNQYRKLKNSR